MKSNLDKNPNSTAEKTVSKVDRGDDDKNLASRSFAAASWMLTFQFATNFLNLLIGFYLARKLVPEDFGVIGVLGIFWAISQVFIQGGFGQALLQRKEVTQEDYSTVFYYNTFLSLLFTFGMIAAAPAIAAFFERPILEKTIVVSSWNMVFTAIASVPRVILGRRLKQGVPTMCHLAALFVSGILAIVMANTSFGEPGKGAWVFVWQIAVSTAISNILVCIYARWVPSLTFSFRALWSLFGFGSNIMIVSFIDAIYNHLRKILIGKFFPVSVLGYYEQTYRYATVWPMSLEASLNNVLFPAFSKLQDDTPRLRQAFKRSLGVSVMIVMLPTILLCALCHPFIVLVISERWLPCEEYWWLMSAVVLFYPLQNLNIQLLKARGYARLFLLLNLVRRGLIVFSALFLYFYGIKAMLIFDVAASLFCMCINTYYTARDLEYGLMSQVRDVWIYPVLALISSALAWFFWKAVWNLGWNYTIAGVEVSLNQWLGFIGGCAIGGFSYLIFNYVLNTPAFYDSLNIMSRKLKFLRRFVKKDQTML